MCHVVCKVLTVSDFDSYRLSQRRSLLVGVVNTLLENRLFQRIPDAEIDVFLFSSYFIVAPFFAKCRDLEWRQRFDRGFERVCQTDMAKDDRHSMMSFVV